MKILEKLDLTVHFKKYLFNTGWLFLEKALRLFGNLIASIFVIRYLGKEHYGMLSIASSIVFLAYPIASLGLDSIVVRQLVQEKRKQNFILGTAFSLKILSAIGSIGILLIAIYVAGYPPEVNSMILLLSSIMIFQTIFVLDNFFQARVESKYLVFSNIIALSISTTLRLLFVVLEMPLMAFAVVMVLETAILAVMLVFYFFRNGFSVFKWKFNPRIAKTLLTHSWPLIFAGFLFTIYMRIDQVMVTEILGMAENGLYAAAIKISESYYFLALIISTSLFPAIIHGKNMGTEVFFKRLQKLFDLLVWLAIIIALPIALLSDIIIKILFSEEFMPAANVLKVHVWGGVFVFISQAIYRYFIVENMQRLGLAITLTGAVVNILLNLFLIRNFGITGAAFATLLSFFVANYLLLAFLPQTRKIFLVISRSFNIFRIIKEVREQKSNYLKG